MSFGFTQTGLNPGTTEFTEPQGPYLSTEEEHIHALRRGLSELLCLKLPLPPPAVAPVGWVGGRALPHTNQHRLLQGEKRV